MTTRIEFPSQKMARIMEVAGIIFPKIFESELFQEELQAKDQVGVYLCVYSASAAAVLCHLGFGTMPLEKVSDRHDFSYEKAHRLAYHPGHVLSRESANPELKRYPGAVRAVLGRDDGPDVLGDTIYSVSGLPGDGDEFAAAWIAVSVGDMSVDKFKKVLANNRFYALAHSHADFAFARI